MAAAVRDSRVSAGKKLKNSVKKKKKMKVVAAAVASELDDKDKDTADNGGSVGSCGSGDNRFSSDDEAVEADNEDEAEPCDSDSEDAAEAGVGTSAGWADAMAKVLNKKIPKSKPTILVKNKELEKEKKG